MFDRNIFTPLCACVTHQYSLKHTIYKFPDIVSVGNLHWGYPLTNGVNRWLDDCGFRNFPEMLSRVQLLTWNVNFNTTYKVDVWV